MRVPSFPHERPQSCTVRTWRLTPSNIEHFGGAPTGDGDEYTAEGVFCGYALAVSHLIEEMVTRNDIHHKVATETTISERDA